MKRLFRVFQITIGRDKLNSEFKALVQFKEAIKEIVDTELGLK